MRTRYSQTLTPTAKASGDAATRAYEKLTRNDQSVIETASNRLNRNMNNPQQCGKGVYLEILATLGRLLNEITEPELVKLSKSLSSNGNNLPDNDRAYTKMDWR